MTKYYLTINNSNVTKVKNLVAERNLSKLSGKFTAKISDPSNTLYDTITSGDEVEMFRESDDKKMFGGFIETIKRDQKKKFELDVNGGDYTTKLNQILVRAQVYVDREYSVVVRNLMHLYLMDDVLLDDCEDTTGWSVGGDIGSLTSQTGENANGQLWARLGTACNQGTATYSTGTGYFEINLSSPIEFSATDYIGFYFYVSDTDDLGTNLTLKIGNDSSNYYSVTKLVSTLQDGWNYLEFDLSGASTTGYPTITSMDWLKLEIDIGVNASSDNILIDDIRRIPHTDDDYTTTGVVITEYYTSIEFKNVSLFEAINLVRKERDGSYDFYVDIGKVLNFATMGSISSGITLEKGVNIIKDDFFDDDTNLANVVTVYGARQVFTAPEETFNGDGTTDTFTLTYEPVDVLVTVDGVEKLGYQTGMAESFDYRIDQNEKQVIFESGSIPGVGTGNVVINYSYSVPLIFQADDSASITNYGKREVKLQNSHLKSRDDCQSVAINYLNKYSSPIVNGNVTARIQPEIDVGETVIVNDNRFFASPQTFTVVSIKHTLLGDILSSEIGLTEMRQSVEEYLNGLYQRINALEEKEKGTSELLSKAIAFLDNLGLTDNPSSNLTGILYLANDSFILDDDINGVLYDDDETAILSDFEDYSQWTDSGLTQTLSDDSTSEHFWTGTQGVKSTWTATTGTGSITDTITSTDISSVTGQNTGTPSQGTAGLWMYCADGSEISQVKLRLGSDSSNYKEYIAQTYAEKNSVDASFTLYDKRNYLLFDLDNPDITVGTVDWTAITYLYIEWTVTGATNATFDYLTVSKNNNIGLNGLGDRTTEYSTGVITGTSS